MLACFLLEVKKKKKSPCVQHYPQLGLYCRHQNWKLTLALHCADQCFTFNAPICYTRNIFFKQFKRLTSTLKVITGNILH